MPDERLLALSFGQIAAEDERDSLPDYFVRSTLFEPVRNGDKWVVLGPKGAGKSALLVAVKNEPPENTLVIDISPDEIRWGEIKSFQDCGIEPPQAKKSAWLAMFLADVAERIETFTGKPYEMSFIEDALRLAGVSVKRNWELKEVALNLRVIAGKFGRGDAVEGIHFGAIVRALKSAFQLLDDAMDADNVKVRLLVDKLDEHWRGNPQDSVTLEGLLLAARELSDITRNIRAQVFLRSDIWSRLEFHDKDKFSAKTAQISWSREDVLRLLSERIRWSTGYDDGRRQTYDFAIAGEVTGVHGGPGGRRDSLDYVWDQIHHRPREVLLLFTMALEERGKNAEQISSENILEAFQKYSPVRLSNILQAEAAKTTPGLDRLVEHLRGLRNVVRWPILERQIQEAGEEYASDPKRWLRSLLEYEILGLREQGADRYFNMNPGIIKVEPSTETTFVFHPALRPSLNLANRYGAKENPSPRGRRRRRTQRGQ